MAQLARKRVLIVGLARTGVAAARFCAEQGAIVTVSDSRDDHELADAKQQLTGLDIAFDLGGHTEALFVDQDLIVLSPGVPPRIPALAAATAAGVPIWSEIELAAQFLRAPVVAVTGTNGKTTTVSLLGDVFQRANLRTFVGGNIGRPLTEAIAMEPEVIVVELSSFQLERTFSLVPMVAALLNVTADHLDRYASMDEYAAAKERLFSLQGPSHHAVLNAEDPYAADMAGRASAQAWPFSSKRRLSIGGWVEGDEIVLDLGAAPMRFDASRRRLIGLHNLENLLVAALCARLMNVPVEAIQATLEGFEGLPHRLELVRSRNGVNYYNDSKATNVEAALRSLEALDGPLLLIVGGQHKGSGYEPLKTLVHEKVRALYLIGDAAPILRSELGGETVVVDCGDLASAVKRATEDASEGDAVLLAPACASFDQYRNYEARGNHFRALVEELP